MAGDQPLPQAEMSRGTAARDAGLRRISATTRWVAAGAVALSGALALIASDAFHGRARAATSPSSSTSISQQSSPSSSSNLQRPAQSPQSSAQQPVAVSGGS